MNNPIDSQREVFSVGLDTELLRLAVLDDEWLDPTEHLKLYKECAMLLSDVCTVTRQFDRKDRAFAEELRLLGLKLMSLLYVANHQRKDTTENMRRALEVLTYQRMLCRICVYQRVMVKKHYAMMALRFDTIAQQLWGWIKSTDKQLKSAHPAL